MTFWMIPFGGAVFFVLFVLSLVVVEYQDQRIRKYDAFRRLQ